MYTPAINSQGETPVSSLPGNFRPYQNASASKHLTYSELIKNQWNVCSLYVGMHAVYIGTLLVPILQVGMQAKHIY